MEPLRKSSLSVGAYNAFCRLIPALERYTEAYGARIACDGKLMGYSGLGTPRDDLGWVDFL